MLWLLEYVPHYKILEFSGIYKTAFVRNFPKLKTFVTKSEEPLKSRDQKVAEVRVDAELPDILIFRRPCSYQKVPLLSY